MMSIIVEATGPNKDHLTLDVPERQVLLVCDPPVQGARYELHILLLRLERALWVALDSRRTIDRYDLNTETEVIPLQRASPYPVEGRPIFALMALTPEALDGFRRQAHELAEVMGFTSLPAAVQVAGEWLFGDTAHPRYGLAVPALLLGSAVTFEARGNIALVLVAPRDGETARWTSAERVTALDLESWNLEKRHGAGRDSRILALPAADTSRDRQLRFTEAYALVDRSAKPSVAAQFCGKNALPEVAAGLAATNMEAPDFAQCFFRSSGLSPGSALAREFSSALWGLHCLFCIDRLNPPGLAIAEHLARTILRIQKGVKRNPRAPDFTGMDHLLRHAELLSGQIYAPEFDKDLAEHQRNDGMLLRNARLARDEEWHEQQRGQQPRKGDHGDKGDKGDKKGGKVDGKGKKSKYDSALDGGVDPP